MKKRFTEEQIIRILREAEGGTQIREVCRRHNITEQTFFRWRNRYGGLEWFRDRKEARILIEQWRQFYNCQRPHSALAYKTPLQVRSEELRMMQKLTVEVAT